MLLGTGHSSTQLNRSPASLYTIDPATGVGTGIGPTGVSGSVRDIAFHSGDTLYLAMGREVGITAHCDFGGRCRHARRRHRVGRRRFGAVVRLRQHILPRDDAGAEHDAVLGVYHNGGRDVAGTIYVHRGAACADHILNAVDRDALNATFYASLRCDGFKKQGLRHDRYDHTERNSDRGQACSVWTA